MLFKNSKTEDTIKVENKNKVLKLKVTLSLTKHLEYRVTVWKSFTAHLDSPRGQYCAAAHSLRYTVLIDEVKVLKFSAWELSCIHNFSFQIFTSINFQITVLLLKRIFRQRCIINTSSLLSGKRSLTTRISF